ncbi:hypothetical protein M7I_3911 [Glarea lozoyensis 74030]|uniref:SEC7 domain-containing protein n=1 Tax=Glarea lozoyensis (strain ATCC 74030 / MF5533) TaxID=1104152 RepID=H0EMR7_GLAL7|nr:hypothetical protein M7I_3911 [Glarea lozoyensis 74030]
MREFRFNGKRIDEALRELLESFRLPGESALIERIITVFSQQYFEEAKPEGVANGDAIFVLTNLETRCRNLVICLHVCK